MNSPSNSPASAIIPISALPASVQAGAAKLSPDEDPNIRYWFPILFGLYEIIMTCDLEVRTRFEQKIYS